MVKRNKEYKVRIILCVAFSIHLSLDLAVFLSSQITSKLANIY